MPWPGGQVDKAHDRGVGDRWSAEGNDTNALALSHSKCSLNDDDNSSFTNCV